MLTSCEIIIRKYKRKKRLSTCLFFFYSNFVTHSVFVFSVSPECLLLSLFVLCQYRLCLCFLAVFLSFFISLPLSLSISVLILFSHDLSHRNKNWIILHEFKRHLREYCLLHYAPAIRYIPIKNMYCADSLQFIVTLITMLFFIFSVSVSLSVPLPLFFSCAVSLSLILSVFDSLFSSSLAHFSNLHFHNKLWWWKYITKIVGIF
jgi:hypothetical protein